MNVSSTYLFHNLGFKGAVLRALFSKSSINKLAMIGDKGDPIATPHVCSYISSLKLKKVDLRQIAMSFDVSGSVSLQMTSMASLMGK